MTVKRGKVVVYEGKINSLRRIKVRGGRGGLVQLRALSLSPYCFLAGRGGALSLSLPSSSYPYQILV
jgi:hypothetical protein